MSALAKFTTALAAAALALPAAASAAEATRYTAAVEFGDLNLASVDGQSALNRRIARAADSVCSQGDALSNRMCKTRALNAAKPAVELAIARVNSGQAMASRETSVTVGN